MLSALVPLIVKALPYLGKGAATALGSTAASAGLSALVGQKGMTQPGQIPPMQSEDPMIALQQLMNRPSKIGRTL